MARREDFHLTSDGLPIFERHWLPTGNVAGVVVLVHGMAEHSGRYGEFAGRLNQHGYAVAACDLRGHGRSAGPRLWIERFDLLVSDLERFLARVDEAYAGKPLFVFGHSMGGAVVALWAIHRSTQVAGVILSAPPVVIASDVFPWLRRLAPVASLLLPRLRLVRLGAGKLSRDPQVVEYFRKDPLVYHGRLPARTGAEVLGASRRLRQQVAGLHLPLLILHGTADAIVDPAGSRLLYDGASSPDKTLRLHEGLYHDLVHEPEKKEVVAEVVKWLDSRSTRL